MFFCLFVCLCAYRIVLLTIIVIGIVERDFVDFYLFIIFFCITQKTKILFLLLLIDW